MANLPPFRGEFSSNEDYQEAYDQWAYEITQEMNTTAAADSMVEMDDQGRVLVDNTPVGYRFRYLDTAYGSDATGADFAITPSALPSGTTPVYQGVRNSEGSAQSTNPADFTWREINSTVLSQNLNAFYRTIGGRNIDWVFGNAATVAGFIEDDGTASIDLDSLPGAVGANGNSAGVVEIFIRASSPPAAPPNTTDYNTADGTYTVPTNWFTSPDAATGTSPIYSSKANFFGVGTVTLDWSTPVRFEGTDVTVTDDGVAVEINDGTNTVEIERPVVVLIEPPVVTLEADYTGDIAVSRTVTVRVNQGSAFYTYDDTSPFEERTFRVHNISEGDASVSNTNGVLTVSDITSDEQVVTFSVSYVDNAGVASTTSQSFDVVRNTVARVFPEVTVSPETITLEANHLGQVTPVAEVITVSVEEGGTPLTYDSTDAGTASTFVITSVIDGATSITDNADGTLTLTDINDDADSQVVTINIRYYDSVGVVYNVQRRISVFEVTAAPPVAELVADPSSFIFENATRTTAQVSTLSVLQDGTALTFTTSTNLADSQWRISAISATPNIGVVNNNDGTLTLANPSNDSGTFVVTVEAQDSFGAGYTLRQRIIYSQVFEAVPEIEITFSADTTIVQNTDGTYSHTSVDAYFRVFIGTDVVARAARQIDFNEPTGAFSINATNPVHPDGNLNPGDITVRLVDGGEFQVEYTG